MTLVTLRPNGTTLNTGTVVGAASAHAAVSDNSDTSYVDMNAGNALVCTLTDLTLPTGAVVRNVAVRQRLAANFGGGLSTVVTCSARIPAGGAGIAGTVAISWSAPTTVTAVTSSGGYSDADLDAADIQIAEPLDAAHYPYQVYEMYLDVVYVALPVAVVNAPTGTVANTNTPLVSWTNTSDGDGGQVSAEVRVFSAAQYGAGGFDPGVSTPTASLNPLVGATSGTVITPLANGTYRAYVRSTQQVNGAPHRSAWAFSQFDINVSLPGVPSLAATADSANGRITLATTDNAGAASTDGVEVQRSTDGGTTWQGVRTADDEGLIAAPFVSGLANSFDGSSTATHQAGLPSDPIVGNGQPILRNDLLVGVAAMDGNPTFTWPADWTKIKDEAGNGSQVRVSVAWKRAVGGESGLVTILTSTATGGGIQIMCIRDAHPTTDPIVSTGVSAATANADPDSLGPLSWGTENTLWIAAMGNDLGSVAVTAGPAGYYGFANARWNNALGAGVASATKVVLTSTENPGAFTHAAEDTRAFTIAVRPRTPNLSTNDYEAPNGRAMQYRARAWHNYAGVFAYSAWQTSSATWSSSASWLKDPVQPALNVAVELVQYGQIARPARRGVFPPLGAVLPVIVSDTRSGAQGQLVARTRTNAAMDTLQALIGTGRPLLLQTPLVAGEPDRYVSIGDETTDREIEDATFPRRDFTLPWVEVAAPDGGVT